MSSSLPNVGDNLSHAVTDVMPPWKRELNERLGATRSRRLRRQQEQIGLPGIEQAEREAGSRVSSVAAKVAQRYANAPSYSDVLAAKARARAAAAVIPAQALPESRNDSPAIAEAGERQDTILAQAPVEEEPAIAAVKPLAVSLVEFPRELVAARRVRPRLAEGPLREASPETEHDQLRIFEVAPESVSQTVSIGKTPADWSPIRLDDEPVATYNKDEPSRTAAIPIKTASLEDRMMAGIFDLALVVFAFALFVLVFVACTAHPPAGKPALLGAALVLAGFSILYQLLFLKFAEGTPGMRYAKIALCTFEDGNPTRKAMCRRVFFLLLSAAPLGLGLAWAFFDPDRLGWHDRMSRIYQRSYS